MLIVLKKSNMITHKAIKNKRNLFSLKYGDFEMDNLNANTIFCGGVIVKNLIIQLINTEQITYL